MQIPNALKTMAMTGEAALRSKEPDQSAYPKARFVCLQKQDSFIHSIRPAVNLELGHGKERRPSVGRSRERDAPAEFERGEKQKHRSIWSYRQND
jgi:hypothetical protein